MPLEEHLATHPDQETVRKFHRMHELLNNRNKPGSPTAELADMILFAEHGSVMAIIEENERLTNEVLKGWIPVHL